jgi:hypothetical protein
MIHKEILEPNAWMKQLWLMPRHEHRQRLVTALMIWLTTSATASNLHQFVASFAEQVRPRCSSELP